MLLHNLNARRVLAVVVCNFTAAVVYAQIQHGEWTIRPADTPGKVHFSLEGSRGPGNTFSSSSDWDKAELQGIDWSGPRHNVKFTIVRDAGAFHCEGFLDSGEGAGLFTFDPDQHYAAEMQALGFEIEPEKQLSFALHNVSLDFARQIKALGIQGVTAEKLIRFRIFKVTPEYVAKLRAQGLHGLTADQLIRLRIFHID